MMPSNICILTDSTAQFPAPAFPGHDLINIIPHHIALDGKLYQDGKDIKASSLPSSAAKRPTVQAVPPSVEEFQQAFSGLSKRYSDIFTITISSHLSETYQNAVQAAKIAPGPASIHVLDSQTTAVGLGLLAQMAAEAIIEGETVGYTNKLIRGLIPRVYTVFCVQSLTYLYHSGHLDPAQAIVGEMLGITPFFILENGKLVPIQKVRNPRHLVDLLHEFVAEFGNLKHIAMLQGNPPMEQEARSLRERLNGDFPGTSISEHHIGAALAAIIGPRCFGVVAMENCPQA
jgi:DegV family protein with EDD domain